MPHTDRTTRSAAAAFVLIVIAWLAALPAQSQQLPLETRELVTTWLMSNCGLGTEPALEDRLRELGEVLEPAFLQALTLGPNERLLAEAEQSAAERFQQRQALLQEDVDVGLSEEALDSARRVDRDDFVERQTADFIARYRSQAVAGLGIVDGPRARRVLEELAADDTSQLQDAARQALEQLSR